VSVAFIDSVCEVVSPPRFGVTLTVMLLPPPDADVVALAMFEYALRFPAASAARTRYLYVVEAVRPESEKLAVVEVLICAKFVQLAPEHRSTR
jgi:hypothetical protein